LARDGEAFAVARPATVDDRLRVGERRDRIAVVSGLSRTMIKARTDVLFACRLGTPGKRTSGSFVP
jgi:hypothetical protein